MPRLDATLSALRRWDEQACGQLNRGIRFPAVRGVFRAVSRLGDGIFWYALMLVLLLAHGPQAVSAVLHMIVVGVACTLAYRGLKQGTLRPRPYQVHAHILAAAEPLDRFSFPSGHTLHAVGFNLVLLAHYPMLGILVLPMTLAIALSRMVLGLHYPSDVVAGAALGAAIAGASFALL
jgi:undecaprenyl-diphosphatase